jgi:Xaa-Pro aminopeptidase
VIDLFPRNKEYRYYADMTRTLSKGTPHHEITRMYHVTRDALDLALGMIRPGVTGKAVFEAVCRFYEEHGYATFLREGRYPETGFIHGLGHGVGLDVHEGPQLGRAENVLREGEVITVEPGLYRPDLGGVRIEDMVVVTADGCRNLTDFPKTLAL